MADSFDNDAISLQAVGKAKRIPPRLENCVQILMEKMPNVLGRIFSEEAFLPDERVYVR